MLHSSPLITPKTLKNKVPLSPSALSFLQESRQRAEKILQGEDSRLVLFAGPCSIHDEKTTLSYALRIKALSEKVSSQIFLVMRVFLEKPRTQYDWKGFLYDPYLDGSYRVEEGVIRSRKLLTKLAHLKVPVATEFLDPLLPAYHADLITWGIIGARTSPSPIHRQMASEMNIPIGFKNETDGTLDNAVYGALAARESQTAISIDENGKIRSIITSGNQHTHLVLRGSLNGPNYDPFSIASAIHKQRLLGLTSRVLIDCAHGNSGKDPANQKKAFTSVLSQILDGNDLIIGMMLESHLEGGNVFSLTDPCLSWKETEELTFHAYRQLAPKDSLVCTMN